MGGSISKKESEPDRIGRKVESIDVPVISYPGPLQPPGYVAAIPNGDPNAISLATQAGLVGPPGGVGVASSVAGLDATQAVPTVFRWEHGGNNVHITGTFNNWSRKVPMHRSGNDFLFIQSLPRGRHAYKFVVDDEWRFAPDQLTVADTAGNINNYIDLTTFKPDDEEPISSTRRESLPGVAWGQALPDEDEYSKEPPLLPPHLRNIILNLPSPDPSDPIALPPPAHVCLNHLYCTAIKDGLMVQATSQRYRRKHVTSVFYSMMSSGLGPGASAIGQAQGIVQLSEGGPSVGAVSPAGAQPMSGPQLAQGQAQVGGARGTQPQQQQVQQQAYGIPPSGAGSMPVARPPTHPYPVQQGQGQRGQPIGPPPPLPIPSYTGPGTTHGQHSPHASGMGGSRVSSISSMDYASKVAAAVRGEGQGAAGGNYAGY